MILLRLEPPWFDLIPLIGLKILAIPFENQLTAGEVVTIPFYGIWHHTNLKETLISIHHETYTLIPKFLS